MEGRILIIKSKGGEAGPKAYGQARLGWLLDGYWMVYVLMDGTMRSDWSHIFKRSVASDAAAHAGLTVAAPRVNFRGWGKN